MDEAAAASRNRKINVKLPGPVEAAASYIREQEFVCFDGRQKYSE